MARYKQIAWFKSVRGRHGYKRIVKYHAVREDGSIRNVDVTRGKTSSTMTFGSQAFKLTPTTKEMFDFYYNAITKK